MCAWFSASPSSPQAGSHTVHIRTHCELGPTHSSYYSPLDFPVTSLEFACPNLVSLLSSDWPQDLPKFL